MSDSNAAPALSMREMSTRSGVSEGTLRMWEARHGFPVPQRLPSGHRRYSELELRRVRAVLLFRFFLLLGFGSLTNSGADIKTES